MVKTSKYMIVIEKIKEWISEGKIEPGEKIFSESELSKMFNVSRTTIRQAIGQLVFEGLLYREQGAGTFCASDAVSKLTPSQQPNQKLGGKNIGLITTYISETIFPEIIGGIEAYLTDNGYSLIISSTDNELDKEEKCLQSILNKDIHGLIIEPTKSSEYNPNMHYYLELEQKKVPYLMINQYYSQLNPAYIILNDEEGGFLATKHLIDLGHEKIIGVLKTDDMQGIYRMKGFIRAFRENNIPFKNETILSYSTEASIETITAKLTELLLEPDKVPTGIVCYTDAIALTVINILRDHGYNPPHDISIIGYDDTFLAEATDIKLTSITHPKKRMGIDAAKWMIKAIENPEELPPSIIYEPKLNIRNSTRRIN